MKDIISMNEVDTQRENDGYGELLAGIRQEFDKSTRDGSAPLFTTNAGDLYGLLLDGIPEEARQHYTAMPAGISSTGMVGWSKLTRRPESRRR